jgi:hypothetical protein
MRRKKKTFVKRKCKISASFETENASRVARWFIFKPKMQFWVNFVGP